MISKVSQTKLKKIRESGKFCCIRIESDYDYVWDIFLIPAKSIGHVITYESGCHEDLNKAVNSIYKQVKDLL